MDPQTSRRACEIIASLLFADGELHPSEERFFKSLLTRFGLPADTKISSSHDEAAALTILRELPEPARRETLTLLIEAAAADGNLHPAERILIGAVADELGVSEEQVDADLRRALSR